MFESFVAHQSFREVRRFRLTPFFFPAAYRLRIFDHRGESVHRLTVCAWDQVLMNSTIGIERIKPNRSRNTLPWLAAPRRSPGVLRARYK
jgi:hypothetical protein